MWTMGRARRARVALQELLRITGSVEAADASEPAEHSVFATALESCRIHRLRHEVLSGQECNERWPGYRLPGSFQVHCLCPAGACSTGCSPGRMPMHWLA